MNNYSSYTVQTILHYERDFDKIKAFYEWLLQQPMLTLEQHGVLLIANILSVELDDWLQEHPRSALYHTVDGEMLDETFVEYTPEATK